MLNEFRDRPELNKKLGLILRILRDPKALPGYRIFVQKDLEDDEGNHCHHVLISRPSDKTFVDVDYDFEKDLIRVRMTCFKSGALDFYESHCYDFRPTYDLEKQLREEVMKLIDCLFGQDSSDEYAVME